MSIAGVPGRLVGFLSCRPFGGTMSERPRRFDESGHKSGIGVPAHPELAIREPRKLAEKHSLNMAAHKLAYRSVDDDRLGRGTDAATARKRFEAMADVDRDVVPHAARAVLALG